MSSEDFFGMPPRQPSFPPGFQMSSEHQSENSENESPEQRDNPGFQGSFRVFSFYKGKHVLK